MTDRAPLDDPAYVPEHPPINGVIPPIVARWGPASQQRWFRRFGNEIGPLTYDRWDLYYASSEHHKGLCCGSCQDESAYGVMQDGWCCCRDERMKR